jgi:hypothetical protein
VSWGVERVVASHDTAGFMVGKECRSSSTFADERQDL